MTTYNTGNPVPSADARDRYDNSQTLDEVVNGESASYTTRTGKQVISLGGMNSRFNNAQNEREVEFNLSQEEKQEAFQSFLDGSGWSSLGAYGAGVVITSHTQTIDYQGQPYQLKPSIPASLDAPYITTGVWATEGVNFKLVGDNSLRQDLSDPITGPALAAWAARKSDLSTVHLYEFTHLVTDRPSPTDKTTWDWAPAIQALWDYSAANGVSGIQPKGLFRYKAQLTPKSGMDIQGSKGAELRWSGSATYAIFSTTAIDGLGAKKIRFTTETGAQLWYSSAASGAIENLGLVKCYFDFSGATQVGYLLNGVRFDNVDGADLIKCKFSGGWRDHAFNSGSPGGSGGNNTARDLEIRGQNVRVHGAKHRNSWSAQYFGNVTNLLTTENNIEDTADTAIFDRCTSGISVNKRITWSTFKNIGKSAIKALDSNNMDTINKGYIAEISHNTVENWGLYIASGAILAGTGFVTSYDRVPSRDYMCKDLTIDQNSFKGTGSILLQVYNILDVKYSGNTADVSAGIQFGSFCDGLKIIGSNVFRTTGRISVFASDRVNISDSDFESPGAFLFQGSASQPFTGAIRFNGNHVKNTAATPPEKFFGIGVTGGAFNVTALAAGNVFETLLNFDDTSESTSFNIASFANNGGSAWVMTDNICKFADGPKTQVQMLGDISAPVYYSGSKGSAKILSTGTIRFGESNTRNDFGAITYTP